VRITFLLTQSLESPSGLGRYWPLAKELQRLGHSVTILALHHDLPSLKVRRLSLQGVHIWYAGQMHVRKRGSDKQYFRPVQLLTVVISATLGLLWAALRVPTDLYHVGKPHPMNGVAGVVASRLRRKPLFLDCDDYEAASNRFANEWQRRVVRFFEDHLPHYTSGITVNTLATARRVKALGYPADQVVVVPNGVDRERFEMVDLERVEQLRHDLGLVAKKVVLYLGSVSLVNHPVDLLVAAMHHVVKMLPDTTLLIVGGGEDLERVETQVRELGLEEHVRFVGRVSPEDVSLYYSLADISVDPVHDDPIAAARSPLKIVESLACGVPVVTGAVGEREELLQDNRLGLVAEAGCPEPLGRQILHLLENDRRRAEMSEAAILSRERWYWDRLVRSFASVYDLH